MNQQEHRKLEAILQICKAVLEAIREFGHNGVPSGHLYAVLMASPGLSLQTYESLIDFLVRSGEIVRGTNHLLIAKEYA